MAQTSPDPGQPDDQRDVIAFLEHGAFGRETPDRIDTHCASVFLVGDSAWKLKRAIRFDYLDFSTAERRHAALEEELRLNRRTAPGLYRAVHAIARSANGGLSIDGNGPAVDWLLEMRRFPDDALFDDRAKNGQLDPSMLMRLSERIVQFHAGADAIRVDNGAERFRDVVLGNIASMEAFPQILDPERIGCLAERLADMTAAAAGLLDRRGRSGRVRHGHGDLHLANIALVDGEPTLFDCLEFSAELATVDVLYDLAFLLMDLWHRDLRAAANIVFNRYLDLSPADEEGLALMPLFLSVRAAIRSHVMAAQAFRDEGNSSLAEAARAYFDLAFALIRPVPPRLVAIGGLSGTGKSTVARMIGGDIGRAPGARIFRSDVVRKRVAGLPPEARLPQDAYSPQSSDAVYGAVDELAAGALLTGQAVIVDAVFAGTDQRGRTEAVAARAGSPFDGFWLEADAGIRLARVGGRRLDASDADIAVARAQADMAIGDLGSWHRIAADGPVAATAREVMKCLRLKGDRP